MLRVQAGATGRPLRARVRKVEDFRTISANVIASQFPPEYFSGAFTRNIFSMARKAARIRKVRPVPKSRRIDVTRAEFDRVIDLLNERGAIINDILEHVERNTRELVVQFTRLAQIQVDLDSLKRAFAKVSLIWSAIGNAPTARRGE